jgi:hypothetical protein
MIINLQNTLQSKIYVLKIKNSCTKDIIIVITLLTLTFMTSKHLLKCVEMHLAYLNLSLLLATTWLPGRYL